MLKTIRTATILAGVSAFALPALAQTAAPIVPGSETAVEEGEAETRTDVADDPAAATDSPTANPENETIVPGNESEIELNNAETREGVAAGESMGETTGAESDGGPLVPGSGATFSPASEPEGQESVIQDESPDQPQ
ncbi:hypothetical protein U0C82_00120 [Fulvimarina sp. 2208YS6-2-32]|uniref:Uncharacterized protein n=1 Tax=Fulvimarina uroteuthidis TaxID=3098149 RepID=A0ABU5HWN1_9HYPH|nr:hypothetical protein [Fulvimarina sp. 2208YS6-2-32]MDY8107551.1 hypothetical protein [Fulvimarina sp. 2208YS6-2-32]